MRAVRESWPAVALLLVVAVALREPLERSMLAHMAVQIPVIALCGYLIGRRAERARSLWLARLQTCNGGGATGLLAAGVVMVAWMLPRLLDEARLDAAVDAAKVATVFAAGFAVAVSWPRCPHLWRGVIHLEAIATLVRFGWGYLVAEQRLCASYLLADQQAAGAALLALAAAWSVVVLWRPLFGRTVPANA
ncbi:MAG: hypothetical protein ACK4V1_03465 [Burkholderiaceae bacterium]